MVILSHAEYQAFLDNESNKYGELQDNRFAVVAGLYIEVIEYLNSYLNGVSFVIVRNAPNVHTSTDCDRIDFDEPPVAVYQCNNTAEAHKKFMSLIEGRLLSRYR